MPGFDVVHAAVLLPILMGHPAWTLAAIGVFVLSRSLRYQNAALTLAACAGNPSLGPARPVSPRRLALPSLAVCRVAGQTAHSQDRGHAET